MSVVRVAPPGILDFWEQQLRMGASGVYGLLLGGDTSSTERQLGQFVGRHRNQLHDMSGVYCALAMIGFAESISPTGPSNAGAGFDYLTIATPADVGEANVYDLARRLDVELSRLPALMLTTDPWSSTTTLVIPVAATVDQSTIASQRDGDDRWSLFFTVLFDACRSVAPQRHDRRLGALEQHLVAGLGKASLRERFLRSGVLAQIVEGAVSGLT